MRQYFALLSFAALVAAVACKEKAPSPDTTAAIKAPPPPPKPDSTPPTPVGPDSFNVHFVTSRGEFDIKVHRSWSPRGADRLYDLVNQGFYNGDRFFRVVEGFMVQFGLNGDPAVTTKWRGRPIPDDSVAHGNRRGVLTFANSGPNSRRTQLFINFVDNPSLDQMGFSGIGEVVSGMSVVDSLYGGYGEGAPRGIGPVQSRIEDEGNKYLAQEFPKLDSIVTAKVTHAWPER